jgi:glycogen(starch) synthase
MKKVKIPKVKTDYVFEVSWEVCNKVGGIYTVLKSKARHLVNIYGRNYYLIGPYFEDKIKGEFEELSLPGKYKDIFFQLEKEGIKCYLGKWLIEGEPNVILIDFKNFWEKSNKIKAKLWEDYKIDSLGSSYDFDEPMVWSYVAGMLIEKITTIYEQKNIIAQFHEWLSGAGLLYLKKQKPAIKIIFTTHATVLGRSLIYNNINFYSPLSNINIEEEVNRLGIKAKHQMEKAAARVSDLFSTVSEITSLEAEVFLKRKPDILLFNGLDLDKFLTLDEIVIKHKKENIRLKEFLFYYFFPYYTFDLDNTLFYFIAGRYEFRTKGIDILIRALDQLNQKLIQARSKKNIIVFFFIPSMVKNIKPELLENKNFFEDIKDSLEDLSSEIQRKIIYLFLKKERFNEKTLFDKDFLFQIKKKLLKFSRKSNPFLTTHELIDNNDPILKSFKEVKLNNKKSDKVKIIFYPIYLTGHDGLINLDYHESVEACHLGIFPSLYEPWGYTPLEAAALGVSSVTTDLAGFGRYCQRLEIIEKKDRPGIFVLERYDKTDEEEIVKLTNFLYKFSQFSEKERIENKIQARKIAGQADWKYFIKNYIVAHNEAINKKNNSR